jgi:hypothetical protein
MPPDSPIHALQLSAIHVAFSQKVTFQKMPPPPMGKSLKKALGNKQYNQDITVRKIKMTIIHVIFLLVEVGNQGKL